MTEKTQAPDPAPARFPAAIWSLLLDVADRKGKPGLGPWQNGDGEPMQDDADAAIAWIKAAAIPAPEGAQAVTGLARQIITSHYTDEPEQESLIDEAWRVLGFDKERTIDRFNDLVENARMPYAQALDLAISEMGAALAAPAPQATDAELERRTGEPHVDGWPLVSGLPAPQALTDEQLTEILASHAGPTITPAQIARAVEAAHGIPAPQTKEPTNDR